MKELLLSLLLFPTILAAQEAAPPVPKTPKHEVGLSLFSMTDARGFGKNNSFSADYRFSPELYYNRIFGKTSLRTSIGYHQQVLFIEPSPEIIWEYYYKEVGIRRTVQLSGGFERSLSGGKLQPFVFEDLMLGYTDHRGVRTYWGCFLSEENQPFVEHTLTGGLLGGAGVKYAVNEHLGVRLETSVQMDFSVSDYSNKKIYWKSPDAHFAFNPVSRIAVSWRICSR